MFKIVTCHSSLSCFQTLRTCCHLLYPAIAVGGKFAFFRIRLKLVVWFTSRQLSYVGTLQEGRAAPWTFFGLELGLFGGVKAETGTS